MRTPRILILLVTASMLLACGKKTPPVWVEERLPGPPATLSAKVRPDTLTLGWTAPEGGADEYIIYAAEGEGGFERLGVVKDTSYVIHGPTEGMRYMVQSRKGKLMGGSVVTSISDGGMELTAPEQLSANVDTGGILLRWSAVASADGYNVYRSTVEGDFSAGPVCVRTLEYLDPELGRERVYYQVRAARDAAGSACSNEGPGSKVVSVGPGQLVPPAPMGLGAAWSGGRAIVFWDESQLGWVSEYRVYRSSTKRGEPVELGVSRTPAFTDRDPLSLGAWYSVRAVGPGGPGPLAGPVQALQR